jgi:hypothetical protein
MKMDMNKAIVLEKYADTEIPMSDWNITGVFHDILMCRYADVPEGDDGSHIIRNGIVVPLDVRTGTWRVVEVLKKGASSSDDISVGDLLMIPNDRGISCVQSHDGKKERFIFINEERIFCKVEVRENTVNPLVSKKKKKVKN